MPDEGIQTKVSVLGDKEYKAALSDITRQLTVLNTDMTASQSAFAGQADSMEAVRSKLQSLQAIYAAHQQKVELIAAQLEKAGVWRELQASRQPENRAEPGDHCHEQGGQ